MHLLLLHDAPTSFPPAPPASPEATKTAGTVKAMAMIVEKFSSFFKGMCLSAMQKADTEWM